MIEEPGVILAVEVVYALPERQVVLPVHAPRGTTARQAVQMSDIGKQFAGLDVATCPLAVFGKRVKDDHEIAEGDRVEICRPLLADPKEVRRQLAALGKSMGGN